MPIYESSAILIVSGVIMLIVAVILLPPRRTLYILGALLLASAVPLSENVLGSRESAAYRLLLRIPIGYLPFIITCAVTAISLISRRRWLQSILRNGLQTNLLIPSIGILFYGLLSILWVVDYLSWLAYFLMWFFYIIFILNQTPAVLAESPRGPTNFIKFYSLISALLSFAGIIRFYAFKDFWLGASALPLLGVGPVSLLTVPLLPLVLSLYLAEGRKAYLLATGALALNTLLLFNRTAFVASIVGVLVFGIMARSFPGIRRLVLVCSLGSVMTVTVGYALAGELLVTKAQLLLNAPVLVVGQPEIGRYDWHRALIRDAAVSIIKDRFLLGTGMGLGNYLRYFPEDSRFQDYPYTKPHNLYLGYLAEFGIFGYAFLIWFLISITRFLWVRAKVIAEPRSRIIGFGFFGGHVSALVIFAGSDSISAPFVWFFWGLAIAFVRFALRQQIGPTKPARHRLVPQPHAIP
jgi:hypothetical protein